MKVCTLASGSKGNSTYVESGDTRILIDAGLSCKVLEGRLKEIKVDPVTISGIFLTHEHRDHVRGLDLFPEKYEIQVFSNLLTGQVLRSSTRNFSKFDEFETGSRVALSSLEVESFPISHDGIDPVGFVVDDGRSRLGIITDLGYLTKLVLHRIRDVDTLIIESNHDEWMLLHGSYPWHLKQRIKGRYGHLSNEAAADAVVQVAGGRLSKVVLAHISEENNVPELAFRTVSEHLERKGFSNIRILLAPQHYVGKMMEF
ncbi:MAG: MBL fold metallo-hydrolase [Fidelibacterota bacterium]